MNGSEASKPRTFALVNPSSRSGKTGQRIAELEQLLTKHIGNFEIGFTTQQGDGVRLAREAAEKGATRIVVAGGDGTVSEALSGLLETDRARDVEVAILPLGTGRDFARLLGLGNDLEAAVARLESGTRRTIDVGRVRCRGEEGAGEHCRYFMNIASVGLPAEAARWLEERSERGKKRGPLSYMMSGLAALARHNMPRVSISVDDQVVYTGTLSLAAIANGRYFGGGMPVAPDASIDDGQFDVVVVQGMSTLGSLVRYPKIMTGRHIDDRLVQVHRGKSVHLESDVEVWLEADGEPLGTLPATVELLAGAVRLFGLP